MPYTQVEKDDGVAVVWLDQPGEKVNKLARSLVDEFNTLLDKLEQDSEVKGVVLISKKKDTFIAGADLEQLLELTQPGQVEELSQKGHRVLNRIADFPKPIVAAVHGAALGGGLEVALACHYRIISDAPQSLLGLPEVKLGLLPAGGGTQRLPRLVELQRALDIMLSGKNVYPHQAKKMGLVDLMIHPYGLLDAAKKSALDLLSNPMKRKKKAPLYLKAIEEIPPARKFVFKKARERVEKQTRGNYPAPLKIIDCVESGFENGMKIGMENEAKAFEELARSSETQELIQLFFNMNSRKKNPLQEKARLIKKISVLGAGFMGAGIANISALHNIQVLLKDVSVEAINDGQKKVWDDLDKKVKKRALSRFDRDKIFSRIDGVLDYRGFNKVDLVIEAVFEDMKLKQKILAETEEHTRDDCIFASNTSSMPIAEIAKNAQRPELVIGMHYFSPVPKMPLLEVIKTKKTAEWVTATAIELGIRQGKSVIVVNDGPGFYTSRILAPMLNEALMLLEENGEIRHIDQVMRRLGFPVGPFTLLDEVGIDVGAHVSEVLSVMFSTRGITASQAMQKMAEAGYKGRKNKKGFYHYDENGVKLPFRKKSKEVNQTAYQFLGGSSARKRHTADEIQNRLILAMINEAAYCLQEKILESPQDGDLGAVLGLGFPPFLGGPFRYLDRFGSRVVLSKLEELERKHGARFAAAQIIRDYTEQNKKFY